MIIYSGEQLIAHWNEGSSDYLLVTFDQLNSEYFASDRFFLKPQVVASDISCIGVMPREQNFYLSPEMEQIAALVAARRAGRKVVLFGQSVGAFAALKYSRLLGADAVIAFSPIFSLRAKDMDFTEERHQRILFHALAQYSIKDRPEFDTMAIRPDDVGGRLVVIYDPAEAIDTFSAETIGNRLPGVELITVPHAGHVMYDESWPAETITGLLDAVLATDASRMETTVTAIRRTRFPFLVRSLTKAANRKPGLFVAAMAARRITTHPEYRSLIGAPFNLRALVLLAERGDHPLAAAHLAVVLRACYKLDIRPGEWQAGATAIELLQRFRCLVLSPHGSFLCWSTEQDHARFEPHPFRLETRLPIVASLRDGELVFCSMSHGIEKPVSLFRRIGDDIDTTPERIEAVGNNQIAIRAGERYLGATPDGGVQIMPVISHQHRLVLLPLADNSELFRRTQTSWLEQAIVNQVVSADAVSVVQRAAPRWRGLFNRR